MFSSGVLLYQMLSGTTPFAGTDEAIMYKIVYEPHKPLSTVMTDAALEPFDAVLDRALAKDPAQRYSSAMEMRTALMALAPQALPDVLPADMVLAPRHEGLEAKPAVAREHDSHGLSGADSRSAASPRSSASLPPGPSKAAAQHGPVFGSRAHRMGRRGRWRSSNANWPSMSERWLACWCAAPRAR